MFKIRFGIAFWLLVALNAPACAQDLFGPPTDYPAGISSQAVFSADLDGDGDNDLAVANLTSNDVSVSRNNGHGTFTGMLDTVNYGVGGFPTSVFIADLDGDGDNDLAVANLTSNDVSVSRNNGHGTFTGMLDTVNYGVGGFPTSVFIADVDGDGDNDLAVANMRSNTVSVLSNNGDGTFAPKTDYEAGDGPTSVFIADLDGDGYNDLTVSGGSILSKVSVLMNNGDGTFAPKVAYDARGEVFIADLDGDGDNDLVTSAVSVFMNNGDGTFAPKVDFADVGGPLFIADLDGDGDNDLAVATGDALAVLLNHGDGTFADEVAYEAGEFPSSGVATSVFSADLDGDGDNDLAVANSYGVSVLLNLSDIPVVVPGLVGDFGGNDEVGLSGFVLFLDAFGTTTSSADWEPTFDLDGNEEIGLSDFVIFLDNFGRSE